MYNRRSQVLTTNWLLLNHNSHVYLFDINSAGSILDGYQKIVYERSDSLYIQDSLQDFYDWPNNISYNVYDERRFDNIYKYIYDCIWSIIGLRGWPDF